MCDELLKLFQPEIDKRVEQVRRETAERVRREDIKKIVGILRRLGSEDTVIKEELMSVYNLTEEEARAYLGRGV